MHVSFSISFSLSVKSWVGVTIRKMGNLSLYNKSTFAPKKYMKKDGGRYAAKDTQQIIEAARAMCNRREQQEPGGAPEPSCMLNPLSPPLSHWEYEDLERDR